MSLMRSKKDANNIGLRVSDPATRHRHIFNKPEWYSHHEDNSSCVFCVKITRLAWVVFDVGSLIKYKCRLNEANSTICNLAEW